MVKILDIYEEIGAPMEVCRMEWSKILVFYEEIGAPRSKILVFYEEIGAPTQERVVWLSSQRPPAAPSRYIACTEIYEIGHLHTCPRSLQRRAPHLHARATISWNFKLL